jgi:hypothetical protein
MTRAAGMVAVDRFAFGEIASPDGTETMADVLSVARPTAAQGHLRKLCAGCHLGTRRASRDDAIRGNGSGCSACHVARKLDGAPRRHPTVDSKVTDDRCLGCHSGSGRVALSYQGLAEVETGRPFIHVTPDVHQAAGMACIDCHLHTDLMGDGGVRAHKADQVEITCEACHGPVRTGGERKWAEIEDEICREILAREKRREDGGSLRKGKREDGRPSDTPTRLGRRGTPLINLLRKSSSSSFSWVLVRKLDGVALPVKQTPLDRNHTLRGHERLSCSACHAAWAPTCDSCHTSFDPSRRQWDFAAGKETAGAWVERSEGFSWAPPLLGVRGDAPGGGRIVPATPGMILDVDASAAAGGKTARRLLSPVEPHTTGRRARTCESCHRAPPAPEFEAGTRTGFRGLNAAEKQRVAAARLEPR